MITHWQNILKGKRMSKSLGKPTNIAKYDEIVGLKDKFIERLGDSHDRSLRGKKEKW